jgi:hypothetical protein
MVFCFNNCSDLLREQRCLLLRENKNEKKIYFLQKLEFYCPLTKVQYKVETVIAFRNSDVRKTCSGDREKLLKDAEG